MSIARLLSAFLGLGAGLLFYLAYRSDHTVGNRLVACACGPSAYSHLKHELRLYLPVPTIIRGCLPSAIWCFIVTSVIGGWKIRRGTRRSIPLAWLAPAINAIWELVQWAGWTDGRADWLDVVAGIAGGVIAQLLFFRSTKNGEEIPLAWSWRVSVMIASIACMGLADVWK